MVYRGMGVGGLRRIRARNETGAIKVPDDTPLVCRVRDRMRRAKTGAAPCLHCERGARREPCWYSGSANLGLSVAEGARVAGVVIIASECVEARHGSEAGRNGSDRSDRHRRDRGLDRDHRSNRRRLRVRGGGVALRHTPSEAARSGGRCLRRRPRTTNRSSSPARPCGARRRSESSMGQHQFTA